MDVIDFDKPEESNVDFLEGMEAPLGAADFVAKRVETPSGASKLPENIPQDSNPPKSPEDSKDLSPEQQLLDTVESRVKEGKRIVVVTDYDKTAAGDDARIDTEFKQASADIISNGGYVIFNSSRDVEDLKEKVRIDGARLIGLLGDQTLDENGKTHINERFRPYQSQQTGVLKEVRERFIAEQLGRSVEVTDQPNIDLGTPEGPSINMQRKGCNEEYPEGINLTLALSNLPPEAQEKYENALRGYYNEAFDRQTASMTPNDKEAFRKLCDFRLRKGMTSEKKQTLDVEIRPASQITKARTALQLLRRPDDPKRQDGFRDYPWSDELIVLGDDPDQDGPSMRAIKTARRFTKGKLGGYGVLAERSQEEERLTRGVNVVVDGMHGIADLMTKIANKVRAHSSPQPSTA